MGLESTKGLGPSGVPIGLLLIPSYNSPSHSNACVCTYAQKLLQARRGNVKDLVARLETAEAKEESSADVWQRKPHALAKLRNDLVQEDALLKEHR